MLILTSIMIKVEAGHLLPSDVRVGEPVTALPETESLWYMGQSKEHRYIISFVKTSTRVCIIRVFFDYSPSTI